MTKYVRFQSPTGPAYGVLEGQTIAELSGAPYANPHPTGATYGAASVKLLYPCEPPKVFAVGRNYKSHLGDRKAPENPELFFKPISCLQNPGDPIVLPTDSTNVHFEGELVLVIGKQISNATPAEACDAIFGVTCGNDISEREWQAGPNKDLQWWRAKGSDTFGPMGPCIVTGIDYSRLLLSTRLNGEVVQRQYTSDLLFDCPAIVSFISQWVTLQPGDVIYTGTPGSTQKLKPGDVLDVEIEGIGTLTNPVVGK